MTKIPDQIGQFLLNVNLMLIHIATAFVMPLRVPFALNQTTLVCVKRHNVK